ncbi:ABC transporter permease [Alcaligenaceae bacterium]|nr:ABC transporter permease [Alcaligenaceae bacterium]
MSRSTGSRGFTLAFPASLVVLVIIVLPMIMMAIGSLRHADPTAVVNAGLTLANYTRFVTDSFYLVIFFDTVKVALVCTVLALVFGFPVAYFLARTQSRYKSLFIILLIFPLLVGSVVRSAGWMIILGHSGVINTLLGVFGLTTAPLQLLYTPAAVIVGTTGIVMPYLILTLQSVLEGLDFSVEEAAQSLGASPMTAFFKIIVPIAAPGIAGGTVLVFILCMNAYATPVLLGGTGITMMAPALYDQITKAADWPFGSAMAIILVTTTLLMALLAHWLISRRYVKTMG